MRLLIADDDGVVTTVIDNIEKFNLDKPMARAEIVNSIQDTLDSISSNPRQPIDQPDDCSKDDPSEFSESGEGYKARDKWVNHYNDLNGAPEGPWDC
jgi:hypothetical protein